jgi:hypothetical protein
MLLMGLGSIEGLDLWMVTDVVLVLTLPCAKGSYETAYN